MTNVSLRLHQLLKQYYGFDSFRPGQEKIATTIVNGQDSLTIMPTGGGKSVCFQIPGLAMTGTVVVISPLISLMEDQVFQLQKRSISAELLSSSLNKEQRASVIKKLTSDQLKFIYISPEQLKTKTWTNLTKKLTIPLVVIDEAHCISQWGHDFRPAYLQIGHWLAQLKLRPTLAAFTATATTETVTDIISSLQLHQPNVFKESQLPAHLSLSIVNCPDSIHKSVRLIQLLQKHAKSSGIIYTLTRKAAEEVSAQIKKLNIHHQWGHVGYYHGGMTAVDRARVQQQFISDQIKIMVATNAFGMGVDKPNVRFVIHYHLPNSIEAYSQEVGRAGRDRQSAWCYLLALKSDLKVNLDLVRDSNSKKDKLAQMVKLVQQPHCLKQQLATYFSLDWSQPNCGNCSSCVKPTMSSKKDSQLYQQLLAWRLRVASLTQRPPSFLLSQYQAAVLSLLRPTTVTQLSCLPTFGTGWIRDCWPLLKSDKIYEIIKEKQT
jgi:ATP-dependent DNA helicase RecQ